MVTDAAAQVLTPAARSRVPEVPLGVYVHVPWCRRRCGYCAFNTWVQEPSGARADGAHDRFATSVAAELDLADRTLGPDRPPLTSVYLGGGTPSLLDGGVLASLLGAVRARFDAPTTLEVTVEANPDDVDDRWLDGALAAGATRLSLGMQSAAPRVLAVLDRVHDPEGPPRAVEAARRAGFGHVGVDLIHGTPGEAAADWERTLDVALAAPVDHLSAYALAVEPGTKLAARVRTGELAEPDADLAADRYEVLDRRAGAVGLKWYELSNWARDDGARCRHNLLAWRNHHWWGVGPGAHSHVGGVRWWNVDHPDDWSSRLSEGRSPVAGREVLTDDQRRLERVLLGVRLAEGLPTRGLDRGAVEGIVADGLGEVRGGRLALSLRGRLLADLVVRRLT